MLRLHGPALALGAALTVVGTSLAPAALAEDRADQVVPSGSGSSTIGLRLADGRTALTPALPLELDVDADGTRDTLAYRLALDPGLESVSTARMTFAHAAGRQQSTRIAAQTATAAQRAAWVRAVAPDLTGIPAEVADQVVAQAAQAAIWRETLGATPSPSPYAGAPSTTQIPTERLDELFTRTYSALVAPTPAGAIPAGTEVRITHGGGTARVLAAASLAPLTRPPSGQAPPATPTPTPTSSTSTSTPPATSTPTPSTTAPTSATSAATPTPTSTAPGRPAPTPTSSGPTGIRTSPAVVPTTPADAALQPSATADSVGTIPVVMPGTGETRRLAALPYAVDLDRDAVRETLGFVLEPDVAVPDSSTVALDATSTWDSSSSPRVVPDPADWETIRGRVAGIGAASATAQGRATMLRGAGLDLADQPAAEVEQLVKQAAQVAVWRLSSGVRVPAGYRYAADPALPVAGDRARLGDAFATLVDRLVTDQDLVPAATATVYEVETAATGAVVRGGRAMPAAAAPRSPSIVVGSAVRAGAPRPPALVPAPRALAPAAAASSCATLHRTDVGKADADYTPALDRDGDGIACESNGQDGAVDLGGGAAPAAAAAQPGTGGVAAVPTPVPVGVPVAGTSSATPFNNCDEARAAGRSDIPTGDPQYQPGLDSDQDGIGCEANGEGAPGTAAGPVPGSTGQLAHTGADALLLVGAGCAATVGGAALIVLSRRRREA